MPILSLIIDVTLPPSTVWTVGRTNDKSSSRVRKQASRIAIKFDKNGSPRG